MKVGIIGDGRRGIGSALLAALAAGGKWLQGKQPSAFIQHGTAAYRPTGTAAYRPTGTALRNPVDPIQAARIEAAAAKRGRRALKLYNHVVDSVLPNRAHGAFLPDEDGDIRFSVVSRLNPFYIAK